MASPELLDAYARLAELVGTDKHDALATVEQAAAELKQLSKVVMRLESLALSAAGHITNKGVGDDFRKRIRLCQSVDL